MREGIVVDVSAADRTRLEAVAADRTSPQKHVWRAKIIPLTADGPGTGGDHAPHRQGQAVRLALAGAPHARGRRWALLRDETRPSRIAPLPQATIDRVIELTAREPPHEAPHWTAPAMAGATGISTSSVQRIWRAHKLQPQRVRRFKLSRDPQFVSKLRDIVGLYVDPPAHAAVLSVDEEPQIRALNRTQPGLPLKPGRGRTMTHDYERHGTTTLFAALDVLEGTVIGRCMRRHRRQEFLRFLNAVEGFCARLTRRRLRRGVFRSTVDLQAAINRFIAEANDHPKPFVWTADPDRVLAAVNRGHQALDAVH